VFYQSIYVLLQSALVHPECSPISRVNGTCLQLRRCSHHLDALFNTYSPLPPALTTQHGRPRSQLPPRFCLVRTLAVMACNRRARAIRGKGCFTSCFRARGIGTNYHPIHKYIQPWVVNALPQDIETSATGGGHYGAGCWDSRSGTVGVPGELSAGARRRVCPDPRQFSTNRTHIQA
jgi:hypothetical protein